jgi:nucleoid-associated protein YgaU
MKTAFKLATVGVMVVLTAACCRKAPKEVGDATAALNEAQKTCTPTYAATTFQDAQSLLNKANDLVANKKCREAKKEALAASEKVKEATTEATAEQARAQKDAEAAIAAAKDAMSAAEQAIGAQNQQASATNQHLQELKTKASQACAQNEANEITYSVETAQVSPATYDQAKAAFSEAERYMGNPCDYYKARDAAKNAMELANKAKSEAESETASIKAEDERKTTMVQDLIAKCKPLHYVVVKGDCLWKISAKNDIYANPFLWPLIWDANRGLIKDHPDLIYPKWDLKINRDYTDADAKKAEKTARNHHWEPPAPPAPKAPETMKTQPEEAPAPAPAPAPEPAPAPAPETK